MLSRVGQPGSGVLPPPDPEHPDPRRCKTIGKGFVFDSSLGNRTLTILSGTPVTVFEGSPGRDFLRVCTNSGPALPSLVAWPGEVDRDLPPADTSAGSSSLRLPPRGRSRRCGTRLASIPPGEEEVQEGFS